MNTPIRIIVHGLDHARAALLSAQAVGVPVLLQSASAAGVIQGAGWWLALLERLRREFPGEAVTGVLDCADSGGSALAALQAGSLMVRVEPWTPGLDQIKGLALQEGKIVGTFEGGMSLDLQGESDPRKACEDFLHHLGVGAA